MAVPDSTAPPGYRLERKRSFTHFAIGVFGALAIIGVLAKIFRFQFELFGASVGWEPFVLIGFIGEACVFIIMGMLKDFAYVPVSGAEQTGRPEGTSTAGYRRREVAIEDDLRRSEESESGNGVPLVRAAEDAEEVSLEETTARMSGEAELLSREMEKTRRTLQEMRREMQQALRRMQKFNQPDASVTMSDSSHE